MQNNRLDKLLEMIKEDPNDSFLKYAIATEYVKLNEFDLALKYYLNLIQSDENYVGTYYHLGKLYELLKLPNEAKLIYEKGMEIAKKISDHHSLSELRAVYNSLLGLDYEDD